MLFAFDARNETPETVARRRAMADVLAGRTGRAQNLGEGVGDMIAGIAAGMMRSRAGRAEKAGRTAASGDFGSIMTDYTKGLTKPLSQSPSAAPQVTTAPQVTNTKNSKNDTGSWLTAQLQKDFGLSKGAAAGFAGNLAHESGNFKTLQEIDPLVKGSRGGFGWSQWTGPRRRQFENWFSENGLDPSSKEANYGFLKHELTNTPEGRVLNRLKDVDDVGAATKIVSDTYLRPGIPHMKSRMKYARALMGESDGVQVASLDPNFTPSAPAAPAQAPQMPPQQLAQASELQPYQKPVIAPYEPSIDVQKVLRGLNNPWTSDDQKQQLQMMLNQEIQKRTAYDQEVQAANDPMNAVNWDKAQLDNAKLRQDLQTGRLKEVNGILMDITTGQKYDPGMNAHQQATHNLDAQKHGYTMVQSDREHDLNVQKQNFEERKWSNPQPPQPTGDMQEYDAYAADEKAAGRQPLSRLEYQKALKPQGATVNVGGEPQDGDLRKSLDKKTGELWGEYQTAAGVSAGTGQDMQLLDELITMAPQGPIQGRAAQLFPGVSSAGAAFQSVVKRVAPTLRTPGSGATSDIEYAGMLESLPGLQNKPEANAAISKMMQAKAQINVERGAIVDAYQNGEINASYARKQLAELNKRSIITPELKSLISALGPQKSNEANPELEDALKLYGD